MVINEVWKDIYFVDKGITYDYRGLYQVSDLGRVKSFPRKFTKKEERILKAGRSNNYLKVVLCKNGEMKTFLVHKLVAFMFVDNPDNLCEVNHKNEDKTCNLATNLEWCNHEYNARYSLAKKVNQYDLKGNFIKTWNCISEASKELGINNKNIDSCLHKRSKTAGNYIWKYREED